MRRLASLVLGLFLAFACGPVAAQTLEELILQLPAGDFGDRAKVVAAIGATGDERAAACWRRCRKATCTRARRTAW